VREFHLTRLPWAAGGYWQLNRAAASRNRRC